jgi:ribosome biogenesis GTPase
MTILARQDYFQIEIGDPREALKKAFEIKALIKKVEPLDERKKISTIDVRLSIGIGEKTYAGESISESNGQAFINAGDKFDLLNKKGVIFQDALMDLYSHLGYDCVSTSTLTKKGIEEFLAKLANKISLISGHSGVGKSTLINILEPDLDLATSEISDFSSKGVHTTTFAEMFELPNKTFIIDSPGIKELGLVDIANEELAHYFPEFRDLLGLCKFHNCLHINEPKCVVKDAVEAGEISESRYLSYLSMFENDDNRR